VDGSVGEFEGWPEGWTVGACSMEPGENKSVRVMMLGDWEGFREGVLLGDCEGFREGTSLGDWEGFRDGTSLGNLEGFREDTLLGD